MTRTAMSLLAIAAALAPMAYAETRSFPAGDFTGIDTSGVVDVVFETGETASVEVEQEDGDFSDIYIGQDGSTLEIGRNSLREKAGWARNVSIRHKDGRKVVKVNGKRVPTYVIRVVAPTLTEVSVSNSSSVNASGLSGQTFSGAVSSSADLFLSGKADEVSLRASSNGDLDASKFEARDLKLDVSSSADALALVRDGSLHVEASSSADAVITAFNTKRVSIDASSSADVEISGSCLTLEIAASSSADVEARNLTCATGKLQASSGADIDVFLKDSVEARASSGSDIEISGNPPSRDISESSGGDVEIND
ncbi:MAG: DUF2807 domain-containing protein [Hyphomonas sp.]|mgnify:FL=1|tara:strand:- start:18 stop:947 length:930 start_codon:yes stop_codon:yes gene_type:complete